MDLIDASLFAFDPPAEADLGKGGKAQSKFAFPSGTTATTEDCEATGLVWLRCSCWRGESGEADRGVSAPELPV